jgi:hypothetical protein
MSILNLEFNAGTGGRPPRNKRAVKVWLGVGLVAAVLGVGSTLASTITINSNNQTEFGQGYTQSIYCGSSSASTITLTPVSYFDSASNTFYLGQIKVENIPDKCAGVDFQITAYPPASSSTPNTPVPLAGAAQDISTLNVWFANNCPTSSNTAYGAADPVGCPTPTAVGSLIWYDSGTGGQSVPTLMDPADPLSVTVSSVQSSPDASSFILNFPTGTPVATTDSIAKILIETKTDVNGYMFFNPPPATPPTPPATLS